MKLTHKLAEESQRVWQERTDWANQRSSVIGMTWDRPGTPGFQVITVIFAILAILSYGAILVLLGRLVGKLPL